jgi:polysaccharide biosynthesis protein PelG
MVINKVFRITPSYDIPMFMALITALPAIVLFVVVFETNFYDNYRLYYDSVIYGGTLEEIEDGKARMIRSLGQEFLGVIKLQFFFTMIFLLIGRSFLGFMGLSAAMIDTFSILTLAGLSYSGVYMLVMTLLYFDELRGGFYSAFLFFLLCGSMTVVFSFMGPDYAGMGFFSGGVFAFLIIYWRLSYMLSKIDYFTYCRQPILNPEDDGAKVKI